MRPADAKPSRSQSPLTTLTEREGERGHHFLDGSIASTALFELEFQSFNAADHLTVSTVPLPAALSPGSEGLCGRLKVRLIPIERPPRGGLSFCAQDTRPGIRFNEHIEGDGPTVFAHACKMVQAEQHRDRRPHFYSTQNPTRGVLLIPRFEIPVSLTEESEMGCEKRRIAIFGLSFLRSSCETP
jgi:hypothetical protein